MTKQPFYLSKRKLPSGKSVWYYYYYDNQGKRSVPKSTGYSKKQEAFNYCIELLKVSNLEGVHLKFKAYAKGWFEPECRWLKDKAVSKPVKPNTISAYYNNLHKHILPYFGEMDLDAIQLVHIKDFRIFLSEQGLKANSINLNVTILKVMFTYAEEEGKIKKSPVSASIKRIETEEYRSAYTMEEVKFLLHEKWDDYGAWLYCLTGAITGMRFSEVNGLQLRQIHENYIDVDQQFCRGYLLNVKTDSKRFVTAPPELCKLLVNYCGDHEYVFYDEKMQIDPVKRDAIVYQLYKRYSPDMKSRRTKEKLTFHSFRHFLNTFLISNNVQESKINFIIGHSTKKGSMMALYTSWKPEMYKDVLELQEGLFRSLVDISAD